MSEPNTWRKPYDCLICSAVSYIATRDGYTKPYCTACGSRMVRPQPKPKPTKAQKRRSAMWDHYTDDE